MKLRGKKGFTLAELLIVVAIIAILVAVAIPSFTGSLNKAKEATDNANVRAAYSDFAVNSMLEGGGYVSGTHYDASTGIATAEGVKKAFSNIGVDKLEVFDTITVTKSSWTGSGTGGKTINDATITITN